MSELINIKKFLPTNEEFKTTLVRDYLASYDVKYNPKKLNNFLLPKLEKRIDIVKKAKVSKKKTVAIIYERHCNDDATFRYFGLNTRNSLIDSQEWYAECFYNDEIDELLEQIDYFDIAMLIRTRERDDINKLINEFHKTNKPVAYMVDDYCFGDEATPYLFNALNLAEKDEFQKSFWIGAARRFENVLLQCDFFVGATKPLCHIVDTKYKMPTIPLPSCLNKNQEEVSAEVNTNLNRDKNYTFTIAYFSGFNSHTKDFLLCKNSIVKFISEHTKAQLLIVGDLEVSKDVVELYYMGRAKFLPVVDYLTLQYLQATSDIVLAPLEVNKFTDCKSPLKIYEAGIVGTPAAASNTKGNIEAIDNGKSGFVCKDEDEWYNAFCKIYEDRQTQEFSKKAKALAKNKYSSKTMMENAEKAFNEIIANGMRLSVNKPTKMFHTIVKAQPDINWDDQIKVNIYYGLNKLKTLQPLSTEDNTQKTKKQNYILRQSKRIIPSLKKNGFYGSMSTFYRLFMTKYFGRFGYVYKGSFVMRYCVKKDKKRNPEEPIFYDVLLINGCDYCLPHPIRYRVDHQMEQLRSEGLKCKKIDAWDLTLDDAGTARSFIIFRCPYSKHIGKFIDLVKKLNKQIYFDIDDLVIDTKYTNLIPTVARMNKKEKTQYDDGVIGYGKTLKACGKAITTTEGMAEELSNYVDEVFINRNVASMGMAGMSKMALDGLAGHGDEIRLGYFSGSITHNDDFEMILPSILKLFKNYKNTKLHIIGELTVPKELKDYEDRIVSLQFVPWPDLPTLIANVDINLAPIQDTIFNRAKSENKWVEASLVKVPTIASNVGAFAKVIKNRKTGILCNTTEEWYDCLEELCINANLRETIANNAYAECSNKYLTLGSGRKLADYIRGNQCENIAFLSFAVDNSGGAMVAKKHAEILNKHGFDVMFLAIEVWQETPWVDVGNVKVPVLRAQNDMNEDRKISILGTIEKAVCTFWATCEDYKNIVHTIKKWYYLVQNYEPGFYNLVDIQIIDTFSTYNNKDTNYITISKWCKSWIENKFHQKCKYAPNGIDLDMFPYKHRDFNSDKVKILIEGDCGAQHKNVDEAFKIAELLDKDKFEITYLSYGNKKKDWYRIDKFYSNLEHDKVYEIYQSCDILLKTSKLESFSYPPLEMMATGGFVVAIKNEGNVEFMKDGYNCLFYEAGNYHDAITKIMQIVYDDDLRDTLEKNGQETAKNRSWDLIEDKIVDLYK